MSVGSTPTRATDSVVKIVSGFKKCVGWALASLGACKALAFGLCRFDSCPAHFRKAEVRSQNAEVRPVRLMAGRWVLSPATGVRFPYGSVRESGVRSRESKNGQVVERQTRDAQNVEHLACVGVQVSPWSLIFGFAARKYASFKMIEQRLKYRDSEDACFRGAKADFENIADGPVSCGVS